jgi:hypothetical protein
MQLINRTPFAGSIFVDVDRDGAETLVLALKATYEFGGVEIPRLAEVQDDLAFSDRYAGEPGASSLLYESDANWGRQATDIAFMGYAYPHRDGDRETEVVLKVGRVAKAAQVFGDRVWSSALGRPRISTPKPFERIPLIYERAFGGVDNSPEDPADLEAEPRNPVGRGLRASRSRKPAESIALPNIEDAQGLIRGLDDRPEPVGFTFVAKSWKPRVDYAGTFDAAWQQTRMPLLPKDFDSRFYRASSEGLSAPFFSGGELVDLVNLTPTRLERFEIPRVDLHASFHIDRSPTPMTLRLDTLVIDAVNSKLVMVWHGAYPILGLVDDVRWVLAEGGPV